VTVIVTAVAVAVALLALVWFVVTACANGWWERRP
jgi:hypothetical protein